MTYVNNQNNNRGSKPLSTRAVVIIVLVIVLAVIEAIALCAFLFVQDSKKESTSDNTKIIYVHDDSKSESGEAPQSTTQPITEPSKETKSEIVVVTVPPSNNASTPKPIPTPEPSAYTKTDAENFVQNSVYAYVNGINANDGSYIYYYFAPGLASSEASDFAVNSQAVDREEVISISCTATQNSPDKFTVIRKSTIKVWYANGNVKSLPETYKYIVENIDGRLYITSCTAV